jgi:hypothetical protein
MGNGYIAASSLYHRGFAKNHTLGKKAKKHHPFTLQVLVFCGGTILSTRPVGLTCGRRTSNLVEMRFARPVLMVVLGVALAVYAFDCGAMTTPEQAMQCCNSMPCSSQGHHGQDCCKTMPAMHAPFVQPSFAHGIPYSPVVVAVLTTFDESHGAGSSDRIIAQLSHAPPIGYSPAPLPLRI